MDQELNKIEEKNKNLHEEEYKVRFEVKRIIEALLFASAEPLSVRKIRDIVTSRYPIDSGYVKELIEEMHHEYKTELRSMQIEEVASGYLLRTRSEYQEFLSLLFHGKRPDRISHAASEVLAIIAYKQPITKLQIEEIRGVDCTSHIQGLMERELIEAAGRLDVPGRPTLYGVTSKFLKHYGLRDIKDLPPVIFSDAEKKV